MTTDLVEIQAQEGRGRPYTPSKCEPIPNKTTETYLVYAKNMDKFAEEIARLNKRARKIGCSEIQYTTEHAHTETQWYHTGSAGGERWSVEKPGENWAETGRVRELLHLTVTGDSPKYEGYELVSVLEPLVLEDGTAENIVRDLPGKESPKEYRARVGECDHCQTIRRRKETFVVEHEDGSYKMVGRQCLADFLGHQSPHSLAAMAEMLASLATICGQAEEEGWGDGPLWAESWSLECLLSWTVACMKKDGWVSRTAAKESCDGLTATADNVIYLLTPPPAGTKAYKEWETSVEERTPTDEQKKEAEKAIDWVREIPVEEIEKNDYLYNINLIGRAGFASRKLVGYACSIVVAYRKAMEKEIERRKKANRLNEWVGVEGERLTLALRVEYTRDIHTEFGGSTLHKMIDAEGRSFAWFSSGEGYDPGDEIYATGTVKRHSEYQGRKETQLGRVKAVDTAKAEEQIAAYKAKAKLTKPQLKKLERLEGELKARDEAMRALASFEN